MQKHQYFYSLQKEGSIYRLSVQHIITRRASYRMWYGITAHERTDVKSQLCASFRESHHGILRS